MGFRTWLFAPIKAELIAGANWLGGSFVSINHWHIATNERLTLMAKTLADVQAQNETILTALKQNTDLTDSLKTAFNGVRSQIDDLTQQIADLKAAGGASPDDLQALFDQGQSMLTSIDADNLAEAAIANTGTTVAPPTDPAPQPDPNAPA